MPVLRVFTPDGQLVPHAGDCILATMFVPTGPDDEGWHLHLAALTADAGLELDADVFIDRAAFTRLYNAGRPFVENDRRRRRQHGEQVGELLLVVRTLARERPEKASLGKAMRLHAEDMKKFQGMDLLHAYSGLRKAWCQFSSVAHLWAAYRLLRRSEDYGEGADVDWLLLLALAERFRHWAEAHHAPTGSTGTGRLAKPLFVSGEGWRLLTNALLPHDEAARIDRLRLGERAEEMIRSTGVPRKRKLSTAF